jgi:eukaryotic-like serine/threonine-protein kinase
VSSDRWEKLQHIFIAALQCEPGERLVFARQACRGDAPLQAEVESLLRSYDEEASFLKEPTLGTKTAEWILRNLEPSAKPNLVEAKPLPSAPTRRPAAIGRYTILRLVGEGGMGSVFEAEQEQPRRIVALKVIRPGLASPEILWRFRQESEALARLQHPGIAQIYEAGAEESGAGLQPFFAMEFIRGRPLGHYADEHHLNTRQRLELMAQICEAVHHAHQRGLIHRDLKPGNILVDEAGQPKILDFGVVRVTDSDVQVTQQTDIGQLVGTLAYMSPEQVLADPLALDTRSDVYALGVILYQLLAGRLPYRISPKVHEAARAIQEDDPTPLSSINRRYRGDVETIVAKALEKDKARRYASAAGLAGDIRRFLQDQPIIARPPSAIYQLEKFARRHKALVTATAVVFVVLVAGIIVSTREAVLARQAEQTAEAVNNFLQNDLLAQASTANQSGPSTKPDPHLEVRTALDRAAARIAGKFDRQPKVEAAIRDTIGQTYKDLGLYPEARKHLERALDLSRRVLGAENPKTRKPENPKTRKPSTQ